MRLKEWLGEKLQNLRNSSPIDQEERNRIQEENKKHNVEIQNLLDKFTIKQLQNFCTSYIGALPEDEIYDEAEDDDEESESIRPEEKKSRFKFPKRKLSWKKNPSIRRRRAFIEFIWNCVEEGDIRFLHLKDFALNNRIVAPSFFRTTSRETGNDTEFHTILDSIENDFFPERMIDEKELQGQIAVFLKTKFPEKKIEREVKTNIIGNYLDILIDDVYVLEIKQPTTRSQLRNLSAQLEEYQEEYPFLAVIIGDKTELVTDQTDEDVFDSKFEKNLTVAIKEYADKYKIKFGIRTIIFTIQKRK